MNENSNITFTSEILKRGKEYYENDKVKLVYFGKKSLKAIVNGSTKYVVELFFDKSGINNATCTCPFSKGNCKHIAATIFKYNKENNFSEYQSYNDLINGLKLRINNHNASLEEVYIEDYKFLIEHIDILSEIEKAKILFQFLVLEIKSQNNINNFVLKFISLIKKNTFSSSIINSFFTQFLNNRLQLDNNFEKLFISFLQDDQLSEPLQNSLSELIKIDGCNYYFQRIIIEQISNNFIFNEQFYLSILTVIDVFKYKMDKIFNTCLNNNYSLAVRKIIVQYRDYIDTSLLLIAFNHFVETQNFSDAKLIADYLLKQIHTFNYYLSYRKIWDKEELESKINYALQIAKNYKFEGSINIYEGKNITNAEIQKIPFEDLIKLNQYAKEKDMKIIAQSLVKRISTLLNRQKFDESVFKGLEALALYNKESFDHFIIDSNLLEKITTTSQRREFIMLLNKNNSLKLFNIFVYGD